MTLEQAAITAVATLAGVVATMGLWFKAVYDKAIARLERKIDECEDDRLDLWERISSLGGGGPPPSRHKTKRGLKGP